VQWAYFDTSALIKRYVDEPGRRDVLQLLRRRHCVTTAIAPVEIRSALRRRASDGSLDRDRVPEILKRFEADRDFWTLIEVSRGVLTGAEALVGTHPLRALDAIHLASAQLFADRVAGSELIFVSADERQTTAAAAAGMTARFIGSQS
jgi:predicted nucleic acid-binding protein